MGLTNKWNTKIAVALNMESCFPPTYPFWHGILQWYMESTVKRTEVPSVLLLWFQDLLFQGSKAHQWGSPSSYEHILSLSLSGILEGAVSFLLTFYCLELRKWSHLVARRLGNVVSILGSMSPVKDCES